MRTVDMDGMQVEVPDEEASSERPDYGLIPFDTLANTRDLGGLTALDGRRIKRGLLLRSGALGLGSAQDIARLKRDYDLRVIIDLRNDDELIETPDPLDVFPDVRFVQADILRASAAGISQDAVARVREAQRRAAEEDDPVLFMELLYPHLLLDDSGIEGYQGFLYSLLACDEGTALWHCHVGRDRCGMASMLIEAVLGVSREDMANDYLATNLFAPRQLTREAPASLRSFNAAVDALEKVYGSVLGYVLDELEFTMADVNELRARYLEA